jgi:D-xylose transport system permease protein
LPAKISIRNISMLGALAAIAAFFAIRAPSFLGARNLTLLVIELSITAVLALGMLLIIVPAEIDLSVGSGVGLLGGIASVLVFEHGWPAAGAMALVVAIGVAVWLGMGALIVQQKVPSFIITLGGLLVFKGLHWLVIRSATVPVAPGGTTNLYAALTTYYFAPRVSLSLGALVIAALIVGTLTSRRRRIAIGLDVEDAEMMVIRLVLMGQAVLLFVVITNQYRGLPLSAVVLAAVAWGVSVLLGRMPLGRHLYAIGGNTEAATVSGIAVSRTVISAFAIMGGIVALTGLLETAYAGASTTTVGNLMELDAIAACVIGGTSLRGGRGTVLGVLFGALIMVTLLNGMTLLAVAPELKLIARGSVLALAVWMDVRLSGARK